MSTESTAQSEEVGLSAIQHIGDHHRPAKKKKTNTSLKHLQVFIDKYKDSPNLAKLELGKFDPYRLPYDVINNEEFVGCYVNFLATEALYLDGSNKLIGHSTASGYASTFCTYYLNYYRDSLAGPPLPLRHESWPRKMSLLTQRKQDYHNKNGTKMKTEKETATDDDRKNLGKVCILEATGIGAQMFHISNTAVSLAGRSSDVAGTDLSDVRSHKLAEDLLEYYILIQDTNRYKTSTTMDHRIFPHRDTFFLCYYFSFGYLLLLRESSDSNLFPSFSEKLRDSEKRIDSRVATFFNKTIDMFWTLMYDYAKGE